MQYIHLTLLAFAATALAAPHKTKSKPISTAGLDPNIVFTNSSCTLPFPSYYLPSRYEIFLTADQIADVLGPTLTADISNSTIQDISTVATNLCVAAAQEAGLDDICEFALDEIHDVASHKKGMAADKYRCLTNSLCVAQNLTVNIPTCQGLLAGTDCVATRITNTGGPACN